MQGFEAGFGGQGEQYSWSKWIRHREELLRLNRASLMTGIKQMALISLQLWFSREKLTVLCGSKTIPSNHCTSAARLHDNSTLTFARLGHSYKGWTDGKIGVKWMKDFDCQTKAKANGWHHLLLVDSHKSHYTAGFRGLYTSGFVPPTKKCQASEWFNPTWPCLYNLLF
jgi:hypothetical protein